MRKTVSFAILLALSLTFTAPAFAADSYYFYGGSTPEFYTPTSVSEGQYTIPEPGGYGLPATAHLNAPGVTADVTYPDLYNDSPAVVSRYSATSPDDVRGADGSIGVLKIPGLSLTITVRDGDLTASMRKGAGHIESTSAWDGNIGLAGHNRGSFPFFGKLKNLQAGDTLTYTTILGTRTYTVVFAGNIAENDWSYLQATDDNRLTLITCVADRPEYRLCVQAVENS